MMAGQGRRRQAVVDAVALVNRDVEVRLGGQVFRGVLRAVGEDYLALERASDGRVVLLNKAMVSAIVDQCAPGLRTASRRDAADTLEGEA